MIKERVAKSLVKMVYFMHEYRKTGRIETDNCLILANKAHNYYFSNPLQYKVEFARTARDFFKAIEGKFTARTSEQNINEALKKFFGSNKDKYQYISTELFAIKDRLNIIINNPSLINESTLFVLDHTARFIEIILPYACSVKEEVEHNRKFSFEGIADKEFKFFKHILFDNEHNKYLQSFYDNGWRAQKYLNGFAFIKNYLDLNNPVVKEFYTNYGGYDNFSSLIFARMANEQFMKYLSGKHDRFWNYLKSCLNPTTPDNIKDKIIEGRNNEDKGISMPSRIEALGKAGVLNELIVREAKLVNSRGNNIAHHGIPGVYSSCYHNLELLNYLNKYCK